MQKIKVKDTVVILAGKDKGKKGAVKGINFKTNRVTVEGVNIFKKAQKPTQENPQGGISDVEKSVHISNVALLSPKTSKATKVGFKVTGGKKVRISRSCKSEIK
jgi:large subunit ribosomal protein L24